ncbi:hypothetical protein [Paenibacillus sp. 32352]|uniref:hypothetical protein n=1 Tax=Paenibacillus sp. 32352 TaxID=1969111 RepID=UPI0009ABBCB0|nr:hypothetical protein [Paenibacillus sp. 32352]
MFSILHVFLGLFSFFFLLFIFKTLLSLIQWNGRFKQNLLITVILFAAAFVLSRFIEDGFRIPIVDDFPVVQGLFIIALAIWLIMTYVNNKRLGKQYRMGAHSSFSCLHKYGIPQIPQTAMTAIYVTPDKVVIDWKNKYFELPLYKITGAAAVTQSILSNNYGYLTPEATKRIGRYLAIQYGLPGEPAKLLIFDMSTVFKAKAAASAVTYHLQESARSANGTIQL